MNTRKSARLISKAQAASSIQSSVQTTSKGLETHLQKKQKVSRLDGKNETGNNRTDYNKVKGKRGHLKLMKEMPMEILLEILCLLEPVDLLHLSRASKSLRGLLLSNNIVYLWKLVPGFSFQIFRSCNLFSLQAYENIRPLRPPLCPDGVNIIHYTNFLYGRHCQVKSGCTEFLYGLTTSLVLCFNLWAEQPRRRTRPFLFKMH
jgi:hypothetical protein